ncbi:MAG: SUMF1/EgtB/PvdO family nonheme iron enzyme, partial [Bacteroidota bacterium]
GKQLYIKIPRFLFFWAIGLCSLVSCQSLKLVPITVSDFAAFVEATGYLTDAEKYGWSVVQQDVFTFEVVEHISWQCPTGKSNALAHFPVTQVSFNDAAAYCAWAEVRLPSYEEFWKLAQVDQRPIVKSMPAILPLASVNIVGNVWDITTNTRSDGQIRLAGGSYLCNANTCNGTHPTRILFVDKETGNSHIGFSVVIGG